MGELARSGFASTPPSWFFPSRMVARLTLLLALCSMLQATVALTVAPMRVCAATRGSVAMAEGMRSGDSVKVISGASKVCAIEAQSMWPRPRSPSPMPTAPPPRTVYRQGMVAKLLMIDMKKGKAIVEGVNMRSKHVKPMKEGESGRILKKEFPIAISNIKLESAAEKAPAAAPAA